MKIYKIDSTPVPGYRMLVVPDFDFFVLNLLNGLWYGWEPFRWKQIHGYQDVLTELLFQLRGQQSCLDMWPKWQAVGHTLVEASKLEFLIVAGHDPGTYYDLPQ